MPIALFYGADQWRAEEAATAWLRAHHLENIRRLPSTNITDKSGILEAAIAQEQNLFGGIEGVLITGVTNAQSKSLAGHLPHIRVPVAITAGVLDKKSSLLKVLDGEETHCFNAPNARDMNNIVASALNGISITPEDKTFLVERLPADSGTAIGTLRGLADAARHAPEGCSRELITAMVPNEQSDQIFDTIDAMFDRNTASVIQCLARIDEPNGIRTLRLLAMNLEQAMAIRVAIDNKDNMQQAMRGIRPPIPYFRQNKMIQQIRQKWNKKQIQQAQSMVWETEALIKQGANDHALTSLHIIRMSQLPA